MATLATVRSALVTLTKQLSLALRKDPRCAGMLPPPPRDVRPQDADTKGYWIAVGRLGLGMRVELWLDHYSGLPSPRVWCGISSRSPQRLSQLLAVAPLDGFRKRLVERSTSDVTKSPPYCFTHPLGSKEFDVLVREHYAGDLD